MNRFKTFSVMVALLLLVSGCDTTSFLDQPKSDDGSTTTRISAALPEGYVYDGARHAYRAPAGVNALAAPSYVTAVRLRISSPGVDTRTMNVPLDTLAALVTVTYGEWTFDVLVETDSGLTFTGSTTTLLDATSPSEIVIPLEINAPPVIDRIDVSHTNPKPGDTLVLTAFAHDPDPDDTLTYSWRAVGPDGGVRTASGQTASFVIPPIAGDYAVTAIVTDGHGGSASKAGTVTVDYAKPVIRGVNFGGTLYEGNTISATVDLFQVLTGYTIQWQFTKPDNTKVNVTGLTVTLANATGGQYSYTVKVTDIYGASAIYSGNFTVTCASVTGAPTLTAAASGSVNGTINVSWAAVANAKSYFIGVYDNANALQRTEEVTSGTMKAMQEPVGQVRTYRAQGADCLGNKGPVSAVTGSVTAPGIHQPVDLGQSGSATGSIVLYWTSDTGPVSPATAPTKYTIKATNNGSGTTATISDITYVSSANYWSSACPGGGTWTGACGRYSYTCTSSTSYSFTVTESDGSFTSDASATYTYTCP